MPDVKDSDLLEAFRDPLVSLFQSAAAAVAARNNLRLATLAAQQARTAGSGAPLPSMTAMADHADPLVRGAALAGRATAEPAAGAVLAGRAGGALQACAQAYLDLARAKAIGDPAAIKRAEDRLPFSTCDAQWAETIEEFLRHYTLAKHGNVPYLEWKQLSDFVLPDLPDKVSVAVIGDWGTGAPRALALARAVQGHAPDIVMHLGDIYYSCSSSEADAFLRDIRMVFPNPVTRVFTLCGNHDMYSGAAPYYALLDRLNQPASFFCLRNGHWQLLGMDTGYNDFNPLAVGTVETWIRDGTDEHGRPDPDRYSELVWHADKLANAGGRKTVLLSHHPLFTRNAAIDGNVVNGRLQKQLAPWIDKLTLWVWGHEHNQVVYAPFMGLRRGRCVGASAIPVLSSATLYDPDPKLNGKIVPDLADPATRLGVDDNTGLWDLGYAILELDGAAGHIDYYTFNETDGGRKTWGEAL
jgi:hypothetical protein